MNERKLHPLSVNLHLTERCNMRCRFCFAKYGSCGGRAEASAEEWLQVIRTIARETAGEYSVKLTFAGGEPTLLPYLPMLAEEAARAGMMTGFITNASLISRHFLARFVGISQWVGLSIDSTSAASNIRLGRAVAGKPIPSAAYIERALAVKDAGFKLKINTVVGAFNVGEDFRSLIAATAPQRWKAMQMLVVDGQNDTAENLAISGTAFSDFVRRHRSVGSLIVESSKAMLGSYAMIDPFGRPYGNAGGNVRFGKPVLQYSFLSQLAVLGYSREATTEREGFYY